MGLAVVPGAGKRDQPDLIFHKLDKAICQITALGDYKLSTAVSPKCEETRITPLGDSGPTPETCVSKGRRKLWDVGRCIYTLLILVY